MKSNVSHLINHWDDNIIGKISFVKSKIKL